MASPRPKLLPATEQAHALILERLAPGDTAIDATVGNGHDTKFLADCVGPSGKVIGFDVQVTAVEKASLLVCDSPQVILHQAGHETISAHVSEEVEAVTFNLGYLPAGDKSIITKAPTTIKALETSLRLLSETGIITVVVYSGHEGGLIESRALNDWAASLDQKAFSVIRYGFLNQQNSPPYLLAIEHQANLRADTK